MRWSDASAERIWKWPVLTVTAPLWVPVFGALFLLIKLDEAWGRAAERLRPAAEPHQWFAWRPVSFGVWTDHPCESAWLETVWRGRDRWGDTVHAPTRESLESAR